MITSALISEEALSILDTATRYLKAGWCRGELAKTTSGAWCASNDPNATQWSLYGAIERTILERTHAHGFELVDPAGELARRALMDVLPAEYRRNLHNWNDEKFRTQNQVIDLMTRARQSILRSKKEAA